MKRKIEDVVMAWYDKDMTHCLDKPFLIHYLFCVYALQCPDVCFWKTFSSKLQNL